MLKVSVWFLVLLFHWKICVVCIYSDRSINDINIRGNLHHWNKNLINMRIFCIYFEFLCFLSMALLQGYPTVIMKQEGRTIVHTKYGRMRGRLVEFPRSAQYDLKKPVEAYFGIQYASLRESKLRFMFSSSPTHYGAKMHHASKEMPVCPQKIVRAKTLLDHNMPVGTVERLTRMGSMTYNQTEDCLSLNVYVPQREWNETDKLPVMIFVHGESYEVGTGNAYDGSVLASYGGVIVITVNYRLGVLGFFSTGDAHAEGNYALWDLLAILYWVQENIERFGGDRQKVTLFGHGHGAALVNLLLFTKIAKNKEDLFQHAIIQSGSAFSTWATSINPARCAYLLAHAVNCSSHLGVSEDLVKCLRNKSVEELVRNVPLTPKYYTCFAPVVSQNTLFSGKTIQQMIDSRDTKFANTKIMFGLTRKEAYSYLKQSEIENGISEYRKKQYLRTYVNNVFKCHKQKIYDILVYHYTHWDELQDDKTRRDDVMDLISDGQYKAPLVKMALEHSKTADTYMYSFAYSTQSEEYPQWSGGVHGDELPYIFGAPLVDGLSPFPSKYSPQEKELSKIMMKMWTNFAKTGDPNVPEFRMDSSKDCSSNEDNSRNRWPKYNESSQSYLHITKRCVKAKNYYRTKELNMWLDLIPKFNKKVTEEDNVAHDLDHSTNSSTFEDPGRLINNFYTFPPSPMPPLPPQDWTGWPTETTEQATKTTTQPKIVPTTTPKEEVKTGNIETESSIASPENINPSTSDESSAVPLSITVAVGCALIFLNMLICAGMYYQRERIKKLRQSPPPSSGNDISDTRNNDRNKHRDNTPPEAVNLVHSADTTMPKHTNLNHKPTMDSNPMYSTIGKPVGAPQGPGGYSYSALSQKSSPMHSHNHIHFVGQNPHTGPPSEDGSHTSSSKGPESSARPPGIAPSRSPQMDPRVKHLQRGSHQTSNNAITIV